jgi:OOP family OmpA-OmpF porin
VIDKATGKPLGAKIIYEKLPDGNETGIAQTNPETGEYEIRLPTGHLYGLRSEAEGKISGSQNIDLRGLTAEQVIDAQNFNLDPIEVSTLAPDVTIVLNNIFFDFDKSLLKAESGPELDRMVELLKEKPTMEIEIAGHTDNVGTDKYNMALSERRSKTVVAYLIRQGISRKRLKAKYFGETKPLETNDTEEGREKNRRVEFKILKI